jgi:hypothetical protein
MMFTHEQLFAAVHEVGRAGKPFTSAAVRGALGMRTRDRRALTRFNQEFRAFHEAMGPQLVKLANNRYRLCAVDGPSPALQVAAERVKLEAVVAARASTEPLVAEPEDGVARANEIDLAAAATKRPVERFTLRSALTGLCRPALRGVRMRGRRLRGRVVELVQRASQTLRTRAAYPRVLRQRALARAQSVWQRAGDTPAAAWVLRVYRSGKRSRGGAHA